MLSDGASRQAVMKGSPEGQRIGHPKSTTASASLRDPTMTKTKPSELDQAAADRRIFGSSDLAANAELKVIAEALRELVNEMRLIRTQLESRIRATGRDT
jgi:hypothetical protein